MATEERDTTDDWIVPAERRPPSALELQRQIDVATGIARAAEQAVVEIGQASLEAAEQARLAADHAERSAEASVAAAQVLAAARATPFAPEPAPASELAPAPEPAAAGHEVIPGSELPAGWSPVAPPADRRATAAPDLAPDLPSPGPAPTEPAPVPDLPSPAHATASPGHVPGLAFPGRAPASPGPAPDPRAGAPANGGGAVVQMPLARASGASSMRPSAQPDPFDERMVAFRERAEQLMARLARLEAAPPVS